VNWNPPNPSVSDGVISRGASTTPSSDASERNSAFWPTVRIVPPLSSSRPSRAITRS